MRISCSISSRPNAWGGVRDNPPRRLTTHLRCGVQGRLLPLKLRLVRLGDLHPMLGRLSELHRFVVRLLTELEDVDDPLTDDRTSRDGGSHAAKGARNHRMRVKRKMGIEVQKT